MTKSRKLAYLALLGNTLIWGLAIPIVKRGFADGLTPTQFLLARYLIATAVSLPIFFTLPKKSRRQVLKLKTLLTIVALEILGTVLALWLLYEGVARTTAIEATLIAITWPIFVIIGGVIFLKEREETHEILGLGLALIGTIILVIRPALIVKNGGSIVGNLLIVGQNISIAAYYLLAKRLYRRLNKWAVTHLSFWVGLAGFTAIMLISGSSPINQITSLLDPFSFWPLFAALYMGLAGSILGLTLYLIGQDKIEASEAAIFTYLQPIFAIPLAIILLQESLSLFELVGAGIIALGVFIVERRPRTSRKST